MNRQIRFSITPQILLDAYRLHYKGVDPKRLGIVFGIYACLALIPVVIDGPENISSSFITYFAIMIGLLFGLYACYFLTRVFWLPRIAKRSYAQTIEFHAPFDLTWDDERWMAQSKNGDVRLPWHNFHAWDRDDKVLMLYMSDHMFRLSPASGYADGQIDDIIGLLTKAGVKRRKKRWMAGPQK